MSRGHQGIFIFEDNRCKERLLDLWERFAKRHSITIFAWCIMDNHFHIILQVENNSLSRFMKESNGSFGIWYRKQYGGKGTVFDGRFKSTVIEDDGYLLEAVRYLFQNPVRGGLVSSAVDYRWSSISDVFSDSPRLINSGFLQSVFADLKTFYEWVNEKSLEELPLSNNRWGESLGSQQFRFHALEKSNRRKDGKPVSEKTTIQRHNYKKSKPGDIIERFLRHESVTIEELTARSWAASRLRSKLVVLLRDKYGMKIVDIQRLKPFRKFTRTTISTLYHTFVKGNE
jgi:REP element-mobilizing transposase RayT